MRGKVVRGSLSSKPLLTEQNSKVDVVRGQRRFECWRNVLNAVRIKDLSHHCLHRIASVTTKIVVLLGVKRAAAVWSMSHPRRGCQTVGIVVVVSVRGNLMALSIVGRSITRVV